MNPRLRISFYLYLFLVLMLFTTGLFYLATPTVMPYHHQAIGIPWTDVAFGERVLLWVLVKVTGGFQALLAIAMALILLFPFRRGESWAVVAVPLLGVMANGVGLWATLLVNDRTGAGTPWPVGLVAMAMLFTAIAFSMDLKRLLHAAREWMHHPGFHRGAPHAHRGV